MESTSSQEEASDIAEFIAIENERMVPQPSVSAITNVDDIETYVNETASKFGKGNPYLRAIDLPASERFEVLRELAYMGVTAWVIISRSRWSV